MIRQVRKDKKISSNQASMESTITYAETILQNVYRQNTLLTYYTKIDTQAIVVLLQIKIMLEKFEDGMKMLELLKSVIKFNIRNANLKPDDLKQ